MKRRENRIEATALSAVATLWKVVHFDTVSYENGTVFVDRA